MFGVLILILMSIHINRHKCALLFHFKFNIRLGLASSIAKMEKLKCYHWHDTGGGNKCFETNKVAVGTLGLVTTTCLKPTRRLSKSQITLVPFLSTPLIILAILDNDYLHVHIQQPSNTGIIILYI